MRKLFLLSVLIAVIYISWPVLTNKSENADASMLDQIKTEITQIKEHPDLQNLLTAFQDGIQSIFSKIEQTVKEDSSESQTANDTEKPVLTAPEDGTFAIYNVEIGDDRSSVEAVLGKPKRTTLNEYGTEWNAYHSDYQNFILVSYDEKNEVNGLYTNQDLISSSQNIGFGTSKQTVIELLGEPLDSIRKGLTYYRFEADRDYDVYLLNDSYVTIFYDKHQENIVTSVQIVKEQLEKQKQGFYGTQSAELLKGFEYQMFDITNAERLSHGLPILTWNDPISQTARDHSKDMAKNRFFDHTNLQGQSPFDRMKEDNIAFRVAGENLAAGQFSSIFAHEGLMNSLGHRENILRNDYRNLGVGVAFNSENHPYYTQKYFTN